MHNVPENADGSELCNLGPRALTWSGGYSHLVSRGFLSIFAFRSSPLLASAVYFPCNHLRPFDFFFSIFSKKIDFFLDFFEKFRFFFPKNFHFLFSIFSKILFILFFEKVRFFFFNFFRISSIFFDFWWKISVFVFCFVFQKNSNFLPIFSKNFDFFRFLAKRRQNTSKDPKTKKIVKNRQKIDKHKKKYLVDIKKTFLNIFGYFFAPSQKWSLLAPS